MSQELIWAIVGAVLWVIVGLAGLALIWIITWISTVFNIAEERPVGVVVSIILGIIVWFTALVLVVINSVLSIGNAVYIATNGG